MLSLAFLLLVLTAATEVKFRQDVDELKHGREHGTNVNVDQYRTESPQSEDVSFINVKNNLHDILYGTKTVNDAFSSKQEFLNEQQDTGSERDQVDRGIFDWCPEVTKWPISMKIFWKPEPKDVKFMLYTRTTVNNPKQLVVGDIPGIESTTFNNLHDTIVIIHGLYPNQDWEERLMKELMIKDDYNVIIVNWRALTMFSFNPYKQDRKNIFFVAAQIASLLKDMAASSKNLVIEKVQLVGHSLGAQTSGLVGQYFYDTSPRISVIYGLDPAGPCFNGATENQRLDKSDAQFVYVVHTNSRRFGVSARIGHVDVYPNGGRDQCKQYVYIRGDLASHSRAHQYFVESVNKRSLTYKCAEDYKDFQVGRCLNEPKVFGFDADRSASGSFYMMPELPNGWSCEKTSNYFTRMYQFTAVVDFGASSARSLKIEVKIGKTNNDVDLIDEDDSFQGAAVLNKMFGVPIRYCFPDNTAATYVISYDANILSNTTVIMKIQSIVTTSPEYPLFFHSVCDVVVTSGVRQRLPFQAGDCTSLTT